MSVKHALLGLLAEAPRHGYDLKHTFDEKLGAFWSLNYGQIYTTLDRLLAEGLVACDAIAQQDRPDKKVYNITPQGRAEFDSWRSRPVKPEPRALRDELFVKILFADHENLGALLALIQAQQGVYLAQMMQLTNRKVQIDQAVQQAIHDAADDEQRQQIEQDRLIETMLIDAALFHAEADIRWLRHCEARLQELIHPQE